MLLARHVGASALHATTNQGALTLIIGGPTPLQFVGLSFRRADELLRQYSSPRVKPLNRVLSSFIEIYT